MAMSVATAVVLILLGWACVGAVIGTVALVIRDGRGQIPLEPSDESWTAGNLPSRPYATIRLQGRR
ncbi:hypothetical protein ACFC25_02985 [Pseudarthrobacter sp. NPDC055928]|uniref:hypothetical protein n=1 Tax=unclassified Pseudarthrobacter TaxID=2647000 RepID=UPI0030770AFA